MRQQTVNHGRIETISPADVLALRLNQIRPAHHECHWKRWTLILLPALGCSLVVIALLAFALWRALSSAA